jgi:hypothetical protein
LIRANVTFYKLGVLDVPRKNLIVES